MALNTFVIINNITNLSDARYCAGMGVDVLGFTLEPGRSSSLPQQLFKDIVGWVAGVQLMGDFSQWQLSEINQVAEENALNYVLLSHGQPLPEPEKVNKPVILRLEMKPGQSVKDLRARMETYAAEAEYFLVDSDEINILSDDMLSPLCELAGSFPVIIGFGLTAENILHVLETVQPAGICLKGGNELKPGLRDFDELADILELLQPEED